MKTKQNPQQDLEDSALSVPNTVLIGVDWADKAHAWHMVDANGNVSHGELRQSPTDIARWIESIKQQCPDSRIEICIETSRGALINALLEHEVTLYPINPNALASYRKSFAHGGGKSDRVDARLIFQFLAARRKTLRPLSQNEPLTRKLAALSQDRRQLVQQRVELSNQLKATLKTYFPAAIEIGASKMYADFMVAFLLKYPSLEAAQKAGATKLRKYFFGVGAKAKAQQRVERLCSAKALTTDDVIVSTCSRKVQAICSMLASLNKSIRQYDTELKALVVTHDDYQFVASLPGASSNTQSRLIAALGDDRSRYANPESLQCAAGIAPLTTQSGNQKYVSSRWACTKFIKQTFHEYAGLSMSRCRWAKAYYDSQIKAGKTKQAAKRALAYKWMRIIFRCWQDGVCYDDQKYMQRLKTTGSPLALVLFPELSSQNAKASKAV
jgi:transposase